MVGEEGPAKRGMEGILPRFTRKRMGSAILGVGTIPAPAKEGKGERGGKGPGSSFPPKAC